MPPLEVASQPRRGVRRRARSEKKYIKNANIRARLLITVVMFILHGNAWRLMDLRNILLVGMGLELVAGRARFFNKKRRSGASMPQRVRPSFGDRCPMPAPDRIPAATRAIMG